MMLMGDDGDDDVYIYIFSYNAESIWQMSFILCI